MTQISDGTKSISGGNNRDRKIGQSLDRGVRFESGEPKLFDLEEMTPSMWRNMMNTLKATGPGYNTGYSSLDPFVARMELFYGFHEYADPEPTDEDEGGYLIRVTEDEEEWWLEEYGGDDNDKQ